MKHQNGFLGCKWDFFNILVAICRTIWPYASSQNYVSASKQKQIPCATFIVKSWICLFFYGGHFELSKCLSIELYLRWASLICCPKHQREICKSLKFELCTVPVFLIWSLSSRLVYWSIHFSFPTHEKYVTISETSIFELWTQWTPK